MGGGGEGRGTGCSDQAESRDAVRSIGPDSASRDDSVKAGDFGFARGPGGLAEAGDFLLGGFFAAGGDCGAVWGCLGWWS